MHVGEELRQARLARGLSLEQVSATTRVTFARLDAIERNDVLAIPLVYVRGYVQEFAKQVGLDPHDVATRYIAQFETSAAQPLARAPEIASDDVAPSFADVPIASGRAEQDDARLDMVLEPSTVPLTAAGPRRVHPAVLILAALAATALGFLIGWAGSRGAPWAEAPAIIESDAMPADANRADAERAEPGGGGSDTATPAHTTTATPADRATDATRTAEPASSGARGSNADLEGTWTLSNEVQVSSLATFRGLRLEYRLQLHQDGATVIGEGQKISENGRPLRRSARTPITLSGTIDGDQVRLTFREKGRRRESVGTLQLQRADDGTLLGTFESDAAQSSGQSIVRRAR